MAARNKARSFKSAKNNKAINEFLTDIVGAVTVGGANAMRKIAQRGVKRLVNNVAGYSDYTGVLINSYQAVLFQKGKIKGVGGDFDANSNALNKSSYGNAHNIYRNARNGIVMVTSYKTDGTTPISFWTEGRKGTSIALRIRRNAASKERIRNRYRKGQQRPYKAYGHELSKLRGYSPSTRVGYEVVFDNPAPYAEFVQKNNPGSTVMPMGVANIMPRELAISISDNEIQKAIRNAKTRKKRR